MIYLALLIVIGYIFGCCQTGFFIGKLNQIDIRQYGSGNSGATNALRVLGKKAAFLTFLGDALKGVFTVLIARFLIAPHVDMDATVVMLIGGLASILGHNYPFHMKFKGGKGVATSLGVILLINWKIGLICLLFGVILIAITRMVSLGSISAAVLFAVLTVFIRDSYIAGIEFEFNFIIFGILLAAFVIFNHRSNLKRIISGTENKISFKKK